MVSLLTHLYITRPQWVRPNELTHWGRTCIPSQILCYNIYSSLSYIVLYSIHGLQKQLKGLQQCYSSNHMLINEINIISSIKLPNQDALNKTDQFLCDQARKAIFTMKNKIKPIEELPPDLMPNLFDTLIKPILIYGSDVWGIKSKLWGDTDKVFLQYSRCILRVKATTSNIITVREYCRLPPNTACHISALCFMNRLYHMTDDKLVKIVYCELKNLNSQRFTNWTADALKLVNDLDLDMAEGTKKIY